MCLVLGLFLGTMANSSARLLSSKSVHLILKLASEMSRMCLISKINSLRGNTSRLSVESDVYSSLVVDRSISD